MTTGNSVRRRDLRIVTRWQGPGHAKGDGAYVLARRTDVIVLGPAEGFLGRDPAAWFPTDYELLLSAAFRQGYEPFRFSLESAPAPAGSWLAGKLRNGRLTFTAYLRRDSAAADALARAGRAVEPPWLR